MKIIHHSSQVSYPSPCPRGKSWFVLCLLAPVTASYVLSHAEGCPDSQVKVVTMLQYKNILIPWRLWNWCKRWVQKGAVEWTRWALPREVLQGLFENLTGSCIWKHLPRTRRKEKMLDNCRANLASLEISQGIEGVFFIPTLRVALLLSIYCETVYGRDCSCSFASCLMLLPGLLGKSSVHLYLGRVMWLPLTLKNEQQQCHLQAKLFGNQYATSTLSVPFSGKHRCPLLRSGTTWWE